MRKRVAIALAAGFMSAFMLAGLPASAADVAVIATIRNSWDAADIQIQPGDSITFSNPDGGLHNVCIAPLNKPGAECSRINYFFRNGDPKPDWAGNDTNTATFSYQGVYGFICETHVGSGMVGTITVGNPAPPQPPPSSVPYTDSTPATSPTPKFVITRTVSTPTIAKPAPARPRFVGTLRRKPDKKLLVIDMGSSKAATLKTRVTRRAAGAKKFALLGSASSKVKKGRNLVKVRGKAAGGMKPGSYKVTLYLASGALKSKARTLKFTVK